MTDNALKAWPDVHVAAWAPTKNTLHLYLQMLGKIRVALSPVQPNWMFTALQLSARGLTTGPMPFRNASVQATLDVFSSEIILTCSTGDHRRVAITSVQTIAEMYMQLQSALHELGIACVISTIPQEIVDTTPLNQDTRMATYEPEAVQRWFQAITSTAMIFDAWRSHFFGRTGIQVWWGALDIALLLFNGKHVDAPTDRGYLLKYDLDAEMLNVGLYFGDEKTAPFFYGYIFPQPVNAEQLSLAPSAAIWNTTLKEWILPYDTIRYAVDPTAELCTFLDALYTQCIEAAGWDRNALSYQAPPMLARSL